MNLELTSKIVAIPALGDCNAGRFQAIVEYAAGVYVPTSIAESAEEAAVAFMVQREAQHNTSMLDYDSRTGDQRILSTVEGVLPKSKQLTCND